MKKIGIIIAIALIVICLYAIYRLSPLSPYEKDYYKVVGVTIFQYTELIESKGIPDHEEIIDGRKYVYYDGLELVFDQGTDDWLLQGIRIIGEQHQFGWRRIGVSSTREEVEKAYKHVQKIKDLPEGEFGVIEKLTWVYFEFDEEDRVSKITLTRGW